MAASMPGGKSTAGIAGVINRARHTIYSTYEGPLDPEVSDAKGKTWFLDTGLTRQRMDKLTKVLGGESHRFPTWKDGDIDELVWKVHEHVSNSSNPPYFYGDRAINVRYGVDGPMLNLIDQWVMWLESRTWRRPPVPHWNFGACITYIQLVKTMLAVAGVNAQRAWVHPATPLLPNGHIVQLSDDDLLDVEGGPGKYKPQIHEFIAARTKLSFYARVVLVDKPGPHGEAGYDQFEGCLYHGGKLYPGGFRIGHYPPEIRKSRAGFSSPKDVMRWWQGIKSDQGKFERFLAWRAEKPWLMFFDKDGKPYNSPYDIPPLQRLPLL
jgi:hypothetical protein